jgi:hypothetical protein
MRRARGPLRALWIAAALAMGTAAEPPAAPPPLPLPLDDALDVVPQPGDGDHSAQGTPPPPAPLPAALSTWRSGARPPGVVPAVFVLRAALREVAARRPHAGAESSRVIEIVWNAPGTGK